jgi:Zn ribbon nucleic-acid-binding protein
MPIERIQVLEYECVRCGYKWVNRVNGHDGQSQKNALDVSGRVGTVEKTI